MPKRRHVTGGGADNSGSGSGGAVGNDMPFADLAPVNQSRKSPVVPAANDPPARPGEDHARAAHLNALMVLKSQVKGHEKLIQRLALTATQHVMDPEGGARITLIGPSGCGKTTVGRALAQAIRRPFVEIQATELTATGWQGQDLSETIAHSALRQSVELSAGGKGNSVEMLHQSVIFIDEVDKCSYRGHFDSAYSHYLGKQQSLLGVVSPTGTVRIGGEDISTSNMMVICAGVFEGLRETPNPLPEDLVSRGFMFELIERLGVIHRIPALERKDLESVLEAGLAAPLSTAETLGYDIKVSPEALAFTAYLVSRGTAGPRSGVSWLRSAVEKSLSRMIYDSTHVGRSAVVTPDDIEVEVRRCRDPQRQPGPEDDPGDLFSMSY